MTNAYPADDVEDERRNIMRPLKLEELTHEEMEALQNAPETINIFCFLEIQRNRRCFIVSDSRDNFAVYSSAASMVADGYGQ